MLNDFFPLFSIFFLFCFFISRLNVRMFTQLFYHLKIKKIIMIFKILSRMVSQFILLRLMMMFIKSFLMKIKHATHIHGWFFAAAAAASSLFLSFSLINGFFFIFFLLKLIKVCIQKKTQIQFHSTNSRKIQFCILYAPSHQNDWRQCSLILFLSSFNDTILKTNRKEGEKRLFLQGEQTHLHDIVCFHLE